MNILLVEDDLLLAGYIKKALSSEGYRVSVVSDGFDALKKAHARVYGAIILDIQLPGMSGLTICSTLRHEKVSTPIIILSSSIGSDSIVTGLDAGADDYLTKPFQIEELTARLRAITRRPSAVLQSTLQVADLTINPDGHQVSRGGVGIRLRPKEYELLEYLMKNEGIAMPRYTILKEVWKVHEGKASNRLEVHIRQLRKKIDAPFEKKLIHTIRGFGYKLAVAAD